MRKQIRIHYLQHVPFEGPGCIKEWTEKKNHQLSVTRLYEEEVPPALSEIDWLIIMGGPMGIYDDQEYPWLTDEKRYLRKAVEKNKVIIGICLGAQLLANALGARVNPGKNKEIGWFPISKTETGKASILFDVMPDQITVFHWHGDQFDIPPECLHLVKSEACPNQAFQYKDRIIGLQFHLEATADSIRGMIEHAGSELTGTSSFIQSQKTIFEGLNYCQQGNEIMFSLLDKLSKAKQD